MPGSAFAIGLIIGIAVLLAIIALGKVDICSALIPAAP